MSVSASLPSESLHEGGWWETLPDGKVHCFLCPRHCHIGEGQTGFCFIRKNIGGKLYNLGYGQPAAIQVDPIEKKPLNHFLPGTRVFSMGTAGCNMGCFLPELGYLQVQVGPDSFHSSRPGGSGCRRHPVRMPVHSVYLQRADHMGRIRDRYFQGGAPSGSKNRDGDERICDPRSLLRGLRTH